jgi:hypothetical protein
MALIVEDGTGKADAESYISVADADTYFAARANATWAALLTAAKEAALRAATDYMLGAYAGRWAGVRVSSTQALDWPRSLVVMRDAPALTYYADDAVPAAVARACADLAVRASAGSLLADQGAQVTQETVGPISVSYAAGARQATRYAAVDNALAPLLLGAGAVPVLRA